MEAVDQVGIHVLVVAGRVVAHGVERRPTDGCRPRGRRTRRAARSRWSRSASARLPVVVAEMRLRERDEHAHVVGGPQDLREAQVRAGLAAVVVGVDEVDAEALEPLQALAGRRVAGQRGADLGVVERNGGEEDAACRSGRSPGRRSRTRGSRSARRRRCRAPGPLASSSERLREYDVPGRVEVPEPVGLPVAR